MELSLTNNLMFLYPEIAKQWSIKNDLKPDMVHASSSKRAWWICANGHEWEAYIFNRTRNAPRGCPYCAGQRVLPTNNLAYSHPQIAIEWSPRNTINPDKIMAGTGKKYWWICSQGHEWEASPNNRTRLNSNCPYCLNQRSSATNNLAFIYPELILQWSKKNPFGPETVVPGSGKRVWWMCPEGHEWKASIYSRSRKDPTRCPRCRQRSFLELEIFVFVKTIYVDSISRERGILESKGLELDIYIPSLKFAIEFDGYHWHHSEWAKKRMVPERDARKDLQCKEAGIYLFRVNELEYKDYPHEILAEILSVAGNNRFTSREVS